MAQDDAAPPASRFVRAAHRLAAITHLRDQSYQVSWAPAIKWKWLRIGTQVAPWCPECGPIIGGKFDQRRQTNGQIAHEQWHEALEKWFDKVEDHDELLQRIALLLKPWLEPNGNEDTNASQPDPEDSGPAFYDQSSEQDPDED